MSTKLILLNTLCDLHAWMEKKRLIVSPDKNHSAAGRPEQEPKEGDE